MAKQGKEPVAAPQSCQERKGQQGKRKRKGASDDEFEEQYKRAIDGIKSQGERVVSSMEKMQKTQMQYMNQFMGNFLQALKDN